MHEKIIRDKNDLDENRWGWVPSSEEHEDFFITSGMPLVTGGIPAIYQQPTINIPAPYQLTTT